MVIILGQGFRLPGVRVSKACGRTAKKILQSWSPSSTASWEARQINMEIYATYNATS